MPNPVAGSGPAISKDLRKYVYVLYLSAIGSGAIYPPAKLGNTEPAAPWTRQGRLVGEDIKWNVPTPGFLEGVVGFNKSLKWRVVNKAEMATIDLSFDEADPVVAALLRGTSYNILSSGIYTGEEFVYKTGKLYACMVLIIGTDVSSTREHHVYGGNAMITFRPGPGANYESLDASLVLLDVSSVETFREREWD